MSSSKTFTIYDAYGQAHECFAVNEKTGPNNCSLKVYESSNVYQYNGPYCSPIVHEHKICLAEFPLIIDEDNRLVSVPAIPGVVTITWSNRSAPTNVNFLLNLLIGEVLPMSEGHNTPGTHEYAIGDVYYLTNPNI